MIIKKERGKFVFILILIQFRNSGKNIRKRVKAWDIYAAQSRFVKLFFSVRNKEKKVSYTSFLFLNSFNNSRKWRGIMKIMLNRNLKLLYKTILLDKWNIE